MAVWSEYENSGSRRYYVVGDRIVKVLQEGDLYDESDPVVNTAIDDPSNMSIGDPSNMNLEEEKYPKDKKSQT